jgi:hypothetical protein
MAERIQEVYRTPKTVTADAEFGYGTQSLMDSGEAAGTAVREIGRGDT